MGCGYLLVVAELVHNSLGSHLCVQLHQVGSLNMLMLGILIPCRYHKWSLTWLFKELYI